MLSRHVEVLEGIEQHDDFYIKLQQSAAALGANLPAEATSQHRQGHGGHEEEHGDAIDEDDVGFVDGEDDDSMDAVDEVEHRPVSALETERYPALDACLEDDVPVDVSRQPRLETYEEQEQFLLERLQVPERWVNDCKAVLARSLGLVEEEAWYLIKAGDFRRAHTLLVDTIAPSAIINGELT